MLEDLEDKEGLSNKWLVRIPCKSFFVSADSLEDKQAWMELIGNCPLNLLQRRGSQHGSTFEPPTNVCAASTTSLTSNADTTAGNVAFWSAMHAPSSE